jgi:hypothetical protein
MESKAASSGPEPVLAVPTTVPLSGTGEEFVPPSEERCLDT